MPLNSSRSFGRLKHAFASALSGTSGNASLTPLSVRSAPFPVYLDLDPPVALLHGGPHPGHDLLPASQPDGDPGVGVSPRPAQGRVQRKAVDLCLVVP